MATFTAKFAYDKSTKGTHKYEEIETEVDGKVAPVNIGSLYVKRTSLPSEPPKEITGVFTHD